MKKLLSLLSLLTISGSAVPTTIAASPYQKEQTIRVKRQHKVLFLKLMELTFQQNNKSKIN
ncbi:hypothetical protein [Spiroplasma poulsonii]|uniref:Uncharacterized protein n=1 Tax=Spiroplasma poulsonii TaxID=2138 RepID=A0A2P6F966_9MOLU|nr:hypothetical protein [Spiroplasma poulsonii]PQM29991.1 hypothetical protein SMSRO_SF028740 [Spiroplasma poulsonii]